MFALPGSQRFFPLFLEKVLLFLALRFKCMFHFQSIFIYGVRWGSKFTFFVVPASVFEHFILSLTNWLDTFVKNHLTLNISVYFWTLSSVSCIYISIPIPCGRQNPFTRHDVHVLVPTTCNCVTLCGKRNFTVYCVNVEMESILDHWWAQSDHTCTQEWRTFPC